MFRGFMRASPVFLFLSQSEPGHPTDATSALAIHLPSSSKKTTFMWDVLGSPRLAMSSATGSKTTQQFNSLALQHVGPAQPFWPPLYKRSANMPEDVLATRQKISVHIPVSQGQYPSETALSLVQDSQVSRCSLVAGLVGQPLRVLDLAKTKGRAVR